MPIPFSSKVTISTPHLSEDTSEIMWHSTHIDQFVHTVIIMFHAPLCICVCLLSVTVWCWSDARVDELLDRHFVSTLDLTKGHWQIPKSLLHNVQCLRIYHTSVLVQSTSHLSTPHGMGAECTRGIMCCFIRRMLSSTATPGWGMSSEWPHYWSPWAMLDLNLIWKSSQFNRERDSIWDIWCSRRWIQQQPSYPAHLPWPKRRWGGTWRWLTWAAPWLISP